MTFADPDTLLGQLQRGRGRALRSLSALPRAEAESVVMQCLCTSGLGAYLVTHEPGYVEAITSLHLPVAKLLEHLDRQAATIPTEAADDLLFLFKLCASLGARGDAACTASIRKHVVDGPAWRIALAEGFELLDETTWMKIIGRLSAVDLAVYADADRELWLRMAARYSQERWQIVKQHLAEGGDVPAAWFAEGLWDANPHYREHCIARVDLTLPGVIERLRELALGEHGVAEAARSRLDAARRADRAADPRTRDTP